MRRRVILPIAVVGALALGLSGCNAIPSDGPVASGLADLHQAEQQVLFSPPAPVPGASQEDIVRGFVLAASSNSEDYAVAREYLTPDYAQQWDPYSGALIGDGTRPYRMEDDSVGILSLAVTAMLDEHGDLLHVAPGPTTEVRFELQLSGGEWRIASAPTGVILDRSTFLALWSSHQIYFIGSGGTLVSETRWFLNRPTMATQIISELIGGPSDGMRDVLGTAFPADVELVQNAVPVEDGVARIELSNQVLDLTESERGNMRRQLAASLQLVPGVNSFEVLVGGAVVDEGGVGVGDDTLNAEPVISVVRDGAFGALSDDTLEPFEALDGPVTDLEAEEITLSPDQQGAAVLTSAGTTWITSAGTIVVDNRAGQLAPSVDQFGYIWTSTAAGAHKLTATSHEGNAVVLDAPWLQGKDVSSIRVSPDGSRIAALVVSGEQSAVVVAGVVRDQSGQPVDIVDEAVTQLWASGTPLDLDWIDSQRFAALTRVNGASKVTIGGPGRFSEEAGSVAGGVRLSGDGGRTMLRVLTEDGALYAPQGSGWQQQTENVEVLAKHG